MARATIGLLVLGIPRTGGRAMTKDPVDRAIAELRKAFAKASS